MLDTMVKYIWYVRKGVFFPFSTAAFVSEYFLLLLFVVRRFKDACGLKPAEVVADMTTKDLVKRALAQARHQSSPSAPSMISAEPHQSRVSPRVSAPRPVSPKTLFLPPQLSSATLLLGSSAAASTLARAAAAAAAVRAKTTDDMAGSHSTKQVVAPTPSSPPKSPSRFNETYNREGFEPLDAAGGGRGGGEGGGVQGNLAMTTTPATIDIVDDVVVARRGSWSRPIGPRSQSKKSGSCGGASGGSGSNDGGSIGDCMLRSSSSEKANSRPKNRSKHQVAVVADGDGVAEADEQRRHEAGANGREGDGLIEGRSIVEERGSIVDGSIIDAVGSKAADGSGGDDVSADSRRNPCRDPKEG